LVFRPRNGSADTPRQPGRMAFPTTVVQ
jgi:hypothetical protein